MFWFLLCCWLWILWNQTYECSCICWQTSYSELQYTKNYEWSSLLGDHRGDQFSNIFHGKFVNVVFKDRGFHIKKHVDEQKQGFDLIIANGTLQLNDSNTYTCFHLDADTGKMFEAKAHIVVLGNLFLLFSHAFKKLYFIISFYEVYSRGYIQCRSPSSCCLLNYDQDIKHTIYQFLMHLYLCLEELWIFKLNRVGFLNVLRSNIARNVHKLTCN